MVLGGEDKMNIKTLEKAKRLDSLIKVTEKNINGWENLFRADEVECFSKTKETPIYLTGKKKTMVRDLILSEHQKNLEKYKKEFDSL